MDSVMGIRKRASTFLGVWSEKGFVGGFYGEGLDKKKGSGTGNCGKAI